ncbi:NPCBM/NEW2 domain-containing protein [Aestuariimicrobium soli]|uniref:NPCBM/NEW2 domain-containing protein n=1 Tax=Aestuariimicrobium soli TaxID=2035834 RepID=UPI003EBF1007
MTSPRQRRTTPVTRLVALVAAVTMTLLGLVTAPIVARASTTQPELSPTPYQGWNTYYGLGGDFDETSVLEQARSLVSTGLADAGYDIVWLDGGWQAPAPRGDDGLLRADPDRFPHGMAWLTEQLHALGLKAGIYTDAGPYDSRYCGLGSGGHQQTDADTFAAWGFDAVKVDFLCGFGAKLDPEPAMTAMAQALKNNASGRPMIVNLCNPVTGEWGGGTPEEWQATRTWEYAPAIAESWRTYTDVGFVGQIKFSDVLRNFDANAAHPEAAGPGHWNDPDYLGPQLGMTDTEFRTQLSLWVMSAAPLVIASKVSTLSPASVAALTDPDLMAIQHDRLGRQATRVGAAGATETWVRPLADGSKAVLLLNRSSDTAEVSTTGSAVGIKGKLTVRDVFTDTLTRSAGTLRATVPAHGATVLRVAPEASGSVAPRVVLSADAVLAEAGGTVELPVALVNDAPQAADELALTVRTPEGITLASSTVPEVVTPRRTGRATVTLAIADGAPLGSSVVELELTSQGRVLDRLQVTVTVAPPAPSGTVVLSHHPWISATSGWMDPTVDRSVGGWTPLLVNGTEYATGIGIATPSEIRWFLGGSCQRLTGAAAIDDAVKFDPSGATAEFQVIGDGRVLWSSGLVVRDQVHPFDLDVSGVADLRFVVTDAGDGGYNDRADWLEPTVTCS